MVTTQVQQPVEACWSRVKARLRADVGEDVYSSWFARLEFVELDAATVHLSTPTRFIKQWLQSHYMERLVAVWANEGLAVEKVELTVRGALRPQPAVAPAVSRADALKAAHTEITAPNLRSGPVAAASVIPPVTNAVAVSSNGSPAFEGSPLDPRFTLDTFEEGRSNQLALAASRQVAFRAAGDPVSFNPLFVHAAVGFGKTHLLQAIATAVNVGDGPRRALYLTAEHFMYRFIAALKLKNTITFKDVLREIDVLLIDDLQFLNGSKVQEEFFHTLNTLLDGSRQVVVAADRTPSELDALDPRVRSRLSGGLLVEITAPDLELRRKILQRRITAQKLAFPELRFPEEVLDFVARSVTTNGRDLDGAVNRLVAHNQLTGAAITVDMAEVALRDLLRAREAKRPRIEDIQRVVSQHYSVSKADLLSARRTRAIVRPRQVAMFLAKQLTPRSLPEIGRRFGGRDHTTVLHAVRKIEELIDQDRQLAEDLETLKRLLDD